MKVTSAAQNVTLTNNGAGTLTIGSIATSGDFAQTNNCGTSLASTASCTVFVTFTPTTAGTRNGSLIFTDNGPGSPQSVPLSGTGVPAGLVTLSSNNANFPNTNVGSISAAQTVTLTNTGTASLTINSISVTFNSTNFAETNNCPASLAINANCTISITFTPASEGNSSGAISVSDNAYDTPQTISLFGVGVGALAGFDAGSLTFGTVNVGTTSASQTVHFFSQGNAPLNNIIVSVTGDYAQTNNCPSSLPAGQNCAIVVTFTPTNIGSRNSTLSVSDNAPGSPQTVSLLGNGTGAVINLDKASLTFGSQNSGTTSAAQVVTVTNTGNSALIFSSIQPTGDFAYTTNCPTNIAPNTPCTLSITFTPTGVGPRNGSLILTDNSVGSPQTITLSGTGVSVPVATFTPSISVGLTFAGQSVNTTSVAQSVTLTNTGNAPLVITTVVVTGDFASPNNCASATLSPNQSCNISITFTPTASGTRSGSITVTDNAMSSPQVYPLTGTGIGVPGISFNPPASPGLSFSSQIVHTTSSAQTITVTSSGSAALTISSIATTGDFAQTNNCPASLNVAATCTVSVTFTPTVQGTRLGSVVFTDNVGGSPQSVGLSGTGTPATLVSIAVTSANPSITKGATQQFTATGTFSDNSTQVLSNAVWASGTTTVATINATGLATAVGTGTSAISATSGAITGSTLLTVTPATLVAIAVTPANPSITKGATQQFTATGTFSDNSTQVLSNAVWASGTTTVATINATGLATAVGTGTSAISATSGAITGSTLLTVTPASACATDVSAQIAIARSGYAYNFTTQRFTQTVTLTNAGNTSILGPVSLVLDSLSSNATLFNSSGSTACSVPLGSPFITVMGPLNTGANVSVALQFTNPTKAGITYQTRVLAGGGSR